MAPTGLKFSEPNVQYVEPVLLLLLSVSGCALRTLGVFSWVVNRWRWKKTFLQAGPAAICSSSVDKRFDSRTEKGRFGDKENEVS